MKVAFNNPDENNNFNRLAKLLRATAEGLIEAGELVVKMLEADEDFPDKFNEAFPEYPTDLIYALDRVGRKQLHPKLLFSNCPGAVRLRHLPYELQEKYLSEGPKVMIREGRDWKFIKITIFNLTPDQARQVFAEDHLRNDAEQRAWIEDKQSKVLVPFDEPFRVSGHKCMVMTPCTITRKQLVGILAQME